MEKYDAIYARQSVDKKDSISIESQIEYCKYETRGGSYKVFRDKGYSGKNADRPQFQEMLSSIKRGEVKRVIAYKLDRISRSILDFTTMMEIFNTNGVEFISCTEKFDTSTPMGRAMLNICIVFAQLERETIQMRVYDSYVSRSQKGFYMGGRIPFGYKKEPYILSGKKTSHYAVIPEQAEVVRLVFSMYAQPQTSLGDVVRYLAENNIQNTGAAKKEWSRCRIASMVKNPIYARADLELYRFFKEQGSIMHNDPEDYIGVFGCYLYEDRDAGRKECNLEGQHVVLAPHEGIVPSAIWIKARVKCMNHKSVSRPMKAKNTWLVGKVKCGKCGYAMTVHAATRKRKRRYFACSHKHHSYGCDGVGYINADDLEAVILDHTKERLKQFETLSAPSEKTESPRMHELNIKIEKITAQIEQFLAKVISASETLMAYINQRVDELNEQLTAYKKERNELQIAQANQKNIAASIVNYIDKLDAMDFDDKRAVADQLISVIKITENDCKIVWKF